MRKRKPNLGMKHWVQFYELRTHADGSEYYQSALGSFGLVFLDGRWSTQRMFAEGKELAEKRGYDGYSICRGFRLDNPFQLNASVRPVTPRNKQALEETA